MKKFLLLTLVGFSLLAAGAALVLIFTGPRMTTQANIRAFQAITPLPPPNSLPRTARHTPSLRAGTGQARRAGRIYYRYYCIFCHGKRGDGSAPVGDSYMPVPPDLRQAKYKKMSDADLLSAMLSGTGHAPVLPRVVLPEHRRPLLLYLRTLASQEDDNNER